jgi:hypothetical protein
MCPEIPDKKGNYNEYGTSKLYKVNFTSIHKCGTIEFRQFGSTTEEDTIEECIHFLMRFCAVAICDSSAEDVLESNSVKERFARIISKDDGLKARLIRRSL